MDKINEFLKVNKELKYKQNPSELSSKTVKKEKILLLLLFFFKY